MTYMRDYMVDGILPEADTVCEADVPLLSVNGGKEDVLSQQRVWADLIKDAGAVTMSESEMTGGSGTTGERDSTPVYTAAASEGKSSAALRAVSVVATIVGLFVAFAASC